MSLEDQAREILGGFESTPSEKFLEVLNQIKPSFKNEEISDYLQGKIQKILDAKNEDERKNLCKSLMPYLDWYLQGL